MKKALILVFIQVCLGAALQAAPQTGADSTPQDSEESPITKSKDGGRPSKSVTDQFLSGLRTPIGFSIGAFQAYGPGTTGTTGAPAGTIQSTSTSVTLLQPHLFANAKAKKATLLFDYAVGYKRNNGTGVNSIDHVATAGVNFTLSRNSVLELNNVFSSTFNDSGILPTAAAPTREQPTFAQDFYVPGERVTSNSTSAGTSFRVTKRSNVDVFGRYTAWRYTDSTRNAQGVQVGFQANHQVNKWIFLKSGFSHYLNKVDPLYEPANINSLQVGGFRFKLREGIELSISGGADLTRYQGDQILAAGYQAGLYKNSGSTLASISYRRGLSSAVGPQTTVNGHMFNASITQWMTHRVSLIVNSAYMRGASVATRSRLEYLSGTADLQIVLQRHLLFSTQYAYVSQHGANQTAGTPGLNRYTVTTGIQVLFPSLGRSPRTR